VDCIPISFKETDFFNKSNKIQLITELINGNNEIVVDGTINYPDTTKKSKAIIADEDFAEQMIQTCIHNQKDIKKIPAYENAFEQMVEQIKINALKDNILLKLPEMNYKIYVYDHNNVFLGVANRLMKTTNSTNYILGEYMGKKAVEKTHDKIYLDLCITDDITIRITNVSIYDAPSTSIGYWTLDFTNAKIKQNKETYQDIGYNIDSKINLPAYSLNKTNSDYYNELKNNNTENNIIMFYKNNKPDFSNKIDINKYLIGM
jgi:hypothetical protein